jgi:hypothetical protein
MANSNIVTRTFGLVHIELEDQLRLQQQQHYSQLLILIFCRHCRNLINEYTTIFNSINSINPFLNASRYDNSYISFKPISPKSQIA